MKNLARNLSTLSLAAMLAFPVAAHATVVTSVVISNALPDYLQVAELQAFSGGTDVALASNGATATATSVYDPTGPQSLPGNAIDGDNAGNYYATPGIYHSQTASGSEALTVTFAHAFDITTLSIYGRTDCCSDRDDYTYTLFDGSTQVGTGNLDARATNFATVNLPGAVPEPAAWVMMLAGFGAIGFAMRRRALVSASYA